MANGYKKGAQDTRPWGNWSCIEVGETHAVKQIEVFPGQKLSLQYHNGRSEHWVVVEGVGHVTLDDKIVEVKANENVYIEKLVKHRMHNRSENKLVFVEIQCGEDLREDDIVRLEDDYGRI